MEHANKKYENIIKLFSNQQAGSVDMFDKSILPKIWNESSDLFIKLLCFIRDPRNGKGDKKTAFYMLNFLKSNFKKTYDTNIKNIAIKYGCLKDLLQIANMYVENDSDNTYNNTYDNVELKTFAEILKADLKEQSDKISYAVKWAPREHKQYYKLSYKLANILCNENNDQKNTMEQYRKKYLIPLSKKMYTLEQKMSENNWNIDYNNLPYTARIKYGKLSTYKHPEGGAFMRHDQTNYMNYLHILSKSNNSNMYTSSNMYVYENIVKKLKIIGPTENIVQEMIEFLNKYDDIDINIDPTEEHKTVIYNDNDNDENDDNEYMFENMEQNELPNMFESTVNYIHIFDSGIEEIQPLPIMTTQDEKPMTNFLTAHDDDDEWVIM